MVHHVFLYFYRQNVAIKKIKGRYYYYQTEHNKVVSFNNVYKIYY